MKGHLKLFFWEHILKEEYCREKVGQETFGKCY